MSMNFRVHISGFRNERGQFASLANALPGGVAQAYQTQIAPQLLTLFQQRSPQLTGALAAGWAYNVVPTGEGMEANFFNDVGYVDAVIKGRRPGWIPKSGVANMHFIGSEGDSVFINQGKVYHPGTSPNDFVGDIADQHDRIAVPIVNGMLIAKVNSILR